MTIEHEVVRLTSPLPESEIRPGDINVLIKEARRRQRLRYLAIAVTIIVVLATVVGLSTLREGPHAPLSVHAERNFVNSMTRGTSGAYVATYRVTNYSHFSKGTITVTNLPPAPGATSTPNVNGYSSTLRSAYVFRGTDGKIVQWVQIGAFVTACANDLSFNGLQCSRPSPFDPSNGFAEEGVGLVPAFVLQNVKDFDPTFLAKTSSTYSVKSRLFGRLQCILQKQVKGSMQQTTCLNRSGLLVSWSSRNGGNNIGTVVLKSLGHHPTIKNLEAMRKPTRALILPPV
jgi:hypothetical protein